MRPMSLKRDSIGKLLDPPSRIFKPLWQLQSLIPFATVTTASGSNESSPRSRTIRPSVSRASQKLQLPELASDLWVPEATMLNLELESRSLPQSALGIASAIKPQVLDTASRPFRDSSLPDSRKANREKLTCVPMLVEAHTDHSIRIHSPTPKPRRNITSSTVKRKIKGSTLAGLKTALSGLRRGANVIPRLNSAADMLESYVDNISPTPQGDNDYERLTPNITLIVQRIDEHLAGMTHTRIAQAPVSLVEELKELTESINKKRDFSPMIKHAGAEINTNSLIKCYQGVNALCQQLKDDVTLSVWKTQDESLSSVDETLLNPLISELDPAKQARYDSSAAPVVQRSACAPNTRQLLLNELKDWVDDLNSTKLYWMDGMAGTGKTTIAYSLCAQLEVTHQLAASFFCSRSIPECRSISRIVPTIAYQLARSCRPFRDALCRALDQHPDLANRGMMTQFEKLISDPMRSVEGEISSGNCLAVVIDALDELTDRTGPALVFSTLRRFAGDLPIKFFVTCRPSRNLFSQIRGSHALGLTLSHLHDVDRNLVQADIKTYLRAELRSICTEDEQIRKLAEQSGRLFAHAVATARHIIDKRSLEDKDYESLDDLYTSILTAALRDDDLESWEQENTRAILHTVICTKKSLTIDDLVCILKLNSHEELHRGIENLRPVLHVDDRTGVVSTFHASFSDYMLTAARSGEFVCDRIM